MEVVVSSTCAVDKFEVIPTGKLGVGGGNTIGAAVTAAVVSSMATADNFPRTKSAEFIAQKARTNLSLVSSLTSGDFVRRLALSFSQQAKRETYVVVAFLTPVSPDATMGAHSIHSVSRWVHGRPIHKKDRDGFLATSFIGVLQGNVFAITQS